MKGYTYISLRQAEYLLDAETYARFAEVAHRFFAANGELGRIDEVMITVQEGSVIRARKPREQTEIELWPEEDENEDDFMDRCVGELEVCIGDRAGSVCAEKWDASKELGKKGFVTLSMLSGDLAIAPCGTSCIGCRGDDTKEKWDESQHPRVPAGSPEGGQFGEGGGGGSSGTPAAPTAAKDGKSNYGLVPGDVEKFHALKDEWSSVNNEYLEFGAVDRPDSPEANALLGKMEALSKAMHGLHADPGGPGGIGLPGGPRDVVIVGAGPGGLTASINGAAEGLDTLIVEGDVVPGGQAKFSSRIENFPGFPGGVTGQRLTQGMFKQSERLGTESKLGTRVTGMTYDEATGLKHLTLSNGEEVESRTVILAGGLYFRPLPPFPGSEGPGIIVGDNEKLQAAAKATGKGGNICVIGASNGAGQAALEAARHCDHVYVLARSPIADGMSAYVTSALKNNPKITVIENDEIAKLFRDKNGLPETMETKKGEKVPIKAIGAWIGSLPDTKWMPDSVQRVKDKVVSQESSEEVKASNLAAREKLGLSKSTSHLETALPGVYVVGDIRQGGAGRVGVAAGEGQLALREANAFLDDQRKKAKAAAKAADKPPKKTIKKKPDDQMITEIFDLDRANPWFGQSIEPEPPAKEKDWDESKHPRVPAGEPGGGQFGSGGGPEPLEAGGGGEQKPLLISEKPSQEKIDAWNKQINDRQEELNQAGQTGEHEDDQLNQMSMILSAYSQEDEKNLTKGSGINVRYDLDNKLLAAAYTDVIKRPAGDVAKIAYFGALDKDAHLRVLNDLTERFGKQEINSLEVQRWKDDPSLPLWEQAGFKQREGQAGLTNLSAVVLEKKLRNTVNAPNFDVPVPVSVSGGVGTDFQAEIASTLKQIPPRAMKTMAEGGIRYRIGTRLTDLNPELKGVHPRGWAPGTTWDSAEGMFSHEQMAVNAAEFYRPVGKKEFVRTDRARGLILHESGHAFDKALGLPSKTSSALIYAYTVDRKSIPKEARRALGYYLQKGSPGRSETFAEVFGWQIERGSSRTDIRKYFPKTAELVKKAMLSGIWLEPVA